MSGTCMVVMLRCDIAAAEEAQDAVAGHPGAQPVRSIIHAGAETLQCCHQLIREETLAHMQAYCMFRCSDMRLLRH